MPDGLVRATDAGTPQPSAESGLVKHNVTSNAIRAVELALQLSGNPGLSRHNPLERHYRNVLCSRIHTPQTDSILTMAGKAAFDALAAAERAQAARTALGEARATATAGDQQPAA